MLVVGQKRETLPVRVRVDPSTGLPLLSEQHAVFQLILAHLQLPYSVAEYGCGKKANLIIAELVRMGIPAWALKRGLILEHDMSPKALEELEAKLRPGSLVVDNPLYRLGNLNDPVLRRMLEAASDRIRIEGSVIHAGPFALHHAPRVQFVLARSHVFPIATFWDHRTRRVVDRVFDPTLEQSEPYEVERTRELVRGPEALIFEAALLGRFRLSRNYLTEAQTARVTDQVGGLDALARLDREEHAELVRTLTGAEEESLGDPNTWTYANNMRHPNDGHQAIQDRLTGACDGVLPLLDRLGAAREAHEADVGEIREELERTTDHAEVSRAIYRDALWAEQALEPLATVAITMVAHRTTATIADTLRDGLSVIDYLNTVEGYEQLRGLGVRLRRRIDRLAVASEDSEGRVDARALSDRYFRCVVELIREMNAAGLSVFVDKVGNVHGLLIDPGTREALSSGRLTIAEVTRHAVMFVSHLDTVGDAGRFDGRLGIAAGVEMAQVITDLRRYFDVRVADRTTSVCLGVSAFVGEEMFFTGDGISMPGSAAVCGRASVDRIHEMTSLDGDRFRDRLAQMLQLLRGLAVEGGVTLMNRFEGTDEESLLSACFDPTEFFTRHTYERHIEQGPVLDEREVPMVMVRSVMGILQEDVELTGQAVEAAALELVCRLTDLSRSAPFWGTRATVGILEQKGAPICHADPSIALRCSFAGRANHAGATSMHTRHDPVVAMGRLYRELVKWCDENATDARPLAALVGDVTLRPGAARNVTPKMASATLAVRGAVLYPGEAQKLMLHLQGFAAGTLSQEIDEGGEGTDVVRLERAAFVNVAEGLRLSLDLRAATPDELHGIRDALEAIFADIKERFGVRVSTTLAQELAPLPIEEAGQVLLLERSYGGAHNPDETELTDDLTSGSILQLAVALEVLSRRDLDDLKLSALVRQHLPNRWKRRIDGFVSGAPYDTANVSARGREL